MAEIAFAAVMAAASAMSARNQGKRQKRASDRAMKRQEEAQAVARSAAASERLAQASESKRMRQRQPNTAAILAKARSKRMAGETFLTGSQGRGMMGSTRYLG
jgi:Flp pilus assembly protein TadB